MYLSYLVAKLCEKQEMAAILGAILDFVKGSNVFVGTYVFQNLRISIQFGSLCLKTYI